jgi:hypothetical protein
MYPGATTVDFMRSGYRSVGKIAATPPDNLTGLGSTAGCPGDGEAGMGEAPDGGAPWRLEAGEGFTTAGESKALAPCSWRAALMAFVDPHLVSLRKAGPLAR